MTDFELTQLRQDLMAQFDEMQADELPTGSYEYVSEAQLDWAPNS